MATIIQQQTERTIIDALWTILNQQTESVRQALASRLQDTLSPVTKPIVRKHALSDEELASALADCPSFDETNHCEMTDEQFHQGGLLRAFD